MKFSTALAMALCAASLGAGQAAAADVFTLTSPTIPDDAMLTLKNAGNDKTNHNCSGTNVSPAFAWSNAPVGTKSFAFLMFDPEGRNGLGVSHQVAYGIAATTNHFDEGALSTPSNLFVKGKGTRGFDVYYGPCPPPGTGTHHFIFTVIATDLEPAALEPGLTREQIFEKLQGHAKAVGGLVGRYKQ